MLSRQLRKRALAEPRGEGEGPEPKRPPRNFRSRASAASERQAVSSSLQVRESALFRPVRAVGVVSDGVPFAPASLGTADFITVSVGRGFQVYECDKLRLAYLSPRLNDKVQSLMCVGEVTLTSLREDIVAWHKLVELGRFRGHTSAPTVMCAVGTAYLVSAAGDEVFIWKLSDLGVEAASVRSTGSCVLAPLGKLDIGQSVGECTAMCHPPTYLHKILVAGDSGGLELWNVRTKERVHVFKGHVAKGKEEFSITCLREAPNVLDLVAIGFASGRICILNAREDSCVMEFEQAQGRVTCLAFRTGVNAPSHLVSGSPKGSFVVWDLDKRRAHHVFDDAHQGPVTSAHFLNGQPVLFTGGSDNAIREWIFDTADGLPRLLRFRCGCPGPAKKMFFYTRDDDRQLLVAGGNMGMGYVARVSCTAAHQNVTYSQANLKKLPSHIRDPHFARGRLPPVVDMAFCETRHFDWPAIVTAHEDTDCAFVWSAQHLSLAPAVLRPNSEKDCAPVSAVAISKCGNYVVIGLENGALHRFNLQSQLYRGCIPRPADPMREPPKETKSLDDLAPERMPKPKDRIKVAATRAHLGRVCGVEITSSGIVASAASHPSDSALRLWKLTTHDVMDAVPLGLGSSFAGRSPLLLRAHGALVAVSLDDGALLIVDLHGKSVVRSFSCGLPATDLAFSAEGRWLAAALRGGGLRIFDLPAARCVDSFAFARPALSICFSPSTAFLLTSHAKGNAIQVWANKFLFDPSLSAPLLQPELAEPIAVDEPGEPADVSDGECDDENQEESPGAQKTSSSAEQSQTVDATPLGKELLTLSDVPPAKWLAILHLDTVKERNKPTAPPKPLPNAPFFLPTAHEGVTPRFVDTDTAAAAVEGAGNSRPSFGDEEAAARAEESRVVKGERSPLTAGTPFQAALGKGDFDAALAILKKQTPSGVHVAIEELGPLSGGDLGELTLGLEFFLHHLRQAHYADEMQAYLSLFLQAHGEEIAGAQELRALCSKICHMQEKRWTALDERCQKARCFLGMLTHTQSQW